MRLPRSSGILLHPTSLPGRFGIGDLGPGVGGFLDLLGAAGQRWWQILPLGPTGYGNSPYQSYSSFAGNPLLVSPDRLVDDGLLAASDLSAYPSLPDDRVDFDAVIAAKDSLLRTAYSRFPEADGAFDAFVAANASWLDDYALFMAVKQAHGGAAWYDWSPELVRRERSALVEAGARLAGSVRFYQFVQFLFDRQWDAVRADCRARGLQLIGDLPIFVAQDSADVWARPDLFHLDDRGRPTVVAGVPPDYFSATGQLWGNPLYRWEAHSGEGFAWWLTRLSSQLNRVDLVRLDHFRGFESYWEVPAGATTAVGGRWVASPGVAFLEAVRDGLGGLPLVAEDLGDISPEVMALRDRFDLPGMRVMQFGFQGEPGTEFHLPRTYVNHCLAYTGTHDNDTTVGWFTTRTNVPEADRRRHQAHREYALRYLGSTGDEVHWDVIRAAFASVADTVIVPLQDVLGLGNAARMNVPGLPRGNWGWRFRDGQVRPQMRERLADLTGVYGRWNGTPPAGYGPPGIDSVAVSTAEIISAVDEASQESAARARHAPGARRNAASKRRKP